MIKSKFEDNLEIIEQELSKRKSSWQLSSISWMSFEDVAQQIRIHIFNKWDQWDQSKPLRPWLSMIIKNQMINISKPIYTNYTRPCLKCAYNSGGDQCAITSNHKQCSECPHFAKWQASSKKQALDLKVPVSIDEETERGVDIKNQIESQPQEIINYEDAIPRFHEQMQKLLKPIEYKVYKMLYIENLSEEEAAKEMEYKTSEKGRIPGYKRLKKLKSIIIKKAKTIVCDIL